MDYQARYFQTVTRHFLGLRGAPLFLSPQDVEVIDGWLRQGIPLSIVLDALHSFFDPGSTGRKKRKGARLSHCRREVGRHYEALKERRVGRAEGDVSRKKNKELAMRAVDAFLREEAPAGLSSLRPLYIRASELLASEGEVEDELEALDAEIESALVSLAPTGIRENLRRQVADLGIDNDEEEQRIFRLRLIKHLRSLYRLPYLALFYY